MPCAMPCSLIYRGAAELHSLTPSLKLGSLARALVRPPVRSLARSALGHCRNSPSAAVRHRARGKAERNASTREGGRELRKGVREAAAPSSRSGFLGRDSGGGGHSLVLLPPAARLGLLRISLGNLGARRGGRHSRLERQAVPL